MKAYIIPELTKSSDLYSIGFIATNKDNGDLLYAVDGSFKNFEEDYPEAIPYYEGNWFQNVYTLAPGATPLEKYLNGMNMITDPNPPRWSQLMAAIAASPIFDKLLTTQDANAFSALQTAINYRNMDLFKSLAVRVISAIPGGLTQEEAEELNAVLQSQNFPKLEELTGN